MLPPGVGSPFLIGHAGAVDDKIRGIKIKQLAAFKALRNFLWGSRATRLKPDFSGFPATELLSHRVWARGRLLWEQGAAGSNPAAPTNLINKLSKTRTRSWAETWANWIVRECAVGPRGPKRPLPRRAKPPCGV
jgi:hypothetical protein